mgnify:CR=1 FL=1
MTTSHGPALRRFRCFGQSHPSPLFRWVAVSRFALTLLQVFFVDMAKVSTPWRILSFLVLGLMLIGASYLYYRFKDKILPPKEEVKS